MPDEEFFMQRLLCGAALLGALVLVINPATADEAQGKGKGKGRKKANLETVFKKLDTNNDGKVSLDEFKQGRLAQRIKQRRGEEAVDKLFKAMDTDGDGNLTLDEFKNGMKELRKKFAGKRKKKQDQ
jgi:hypothetical protein